MNPTDQEKGQAILLVVVAMSIFLIGALGLAIDGSQLYVQRTMAQAAADAAAESGAMSIFNGTNTGANAFGSAAFNCGIADARTPCTYARMNGYGAATTDTVAIDFPASVPGVVLSPSDPVKAVHVVVTRNLPTSFIAMLGAASIPIKAASTAAIVSVASPTPIVVTHPTLQDSLLMNGSTTLTITGGPIRSIQVNSNHPTSAISTAAINLSAAGPNGTGGDFGVFGAPSTKPASINIGTTGHYIQPSSPIQDPLATLVSAPVVPAAAPAPLNNGCGTGCILYSPGLYSGGLDIKNVTAKFAPGIYYVQNGDFNLKTVTVGMCTTCATDASTGAGMLVYRTGTGRFVIDTNVDADLIGAGINGTNPPAAPYYGVLFFNDRASAANTHIIGKGNGCLSLRGTMYMTNTHATMLATPTQYQRIQYNGNPCSSTAVFGQIITGALELVGTSVLNMELYPTGFLNIRQVALVK